VKERNEGKLTSRLRVSDDVTRSNDPTRQPPLSSLHDQLLGDPLALTVTRRQALPRTLDVVRLGHARLVAALDGRFSNSDEMVGLNGSGGGDKGEGLGVVLGTEVDSGDGGGDVGGSKPGVGIDPVDLGNGKEINA
jgi:hypothetical protein